MKCVLKFLSDYLCLEFLTDTRHSKHTSHKHSAVIHSLAIVLSPGPWLQQNLHVFQLFEIKGYNFSFTASSAWQIITSSTLLSTWILMANTTIIDCSLCALYWFIYFAYITSFNSYEIGTSTIKMKHRKMK